MSETQAKQDARTAPVLVWDQLKDLSKDELASWRIDPVMNNRTPEERGINLPMPFGWFVVCYSDELAKGEVKPVTYFERELVVWRGEDGAPRVLDAYCPHLGAHLGYGGKVNGQRYSMPFSLMELEWRRRCNRHPLFQIDSSENEETGLRACLPDKRT